jgi:hypothetical protein
MAALIRCHFRFRKKEMAEIDEDEFCELWVQTKYYLETIHQVEFK